MFQENELLRASLAGDRNTFEKIVGRYQSAICAITFSGTGRLDVSEELAQETFVSAWANLHQLRDLSGFRFWLYSIARNALRNYQRQKRPASTDVDLAEATTEDTQNPAEILMREEERILLEQAILRLPVKYREPLVLFCRQERSVREAAEVLGLSEATFRTRLHRARKLLKEQIADRLEQTLRQTGPRKGFTKAVMVAIGSVPVGLSATADAAASGLSGHTALSPGMATISTGVGMKIAVAAALLAVGALVYTQWSNTAVPASRPNDASEIRVEPSAVPSQSLADTRPEPVGENPSAQATDAIASRSESDRDRLPPSPETASSEEPAVLETTVTGTVLDRNTLTPITAARVGFTPAETVTTDPDGRFRLSYQDSREEAQIYVMASGYASQQITMRMNPGNHQGVLLKMAPGVTLVGTVVDPNHDPIENASLYVFGSRFTYARVRSDEEGRFRVDGLDPEDDSVYLVAEPTGHFSGSSVAVTLERLGEETVTEIVLHPSKPRPVLIGQVTNARSEPVAQATVGCIGKRIQTITDSQGRYRLEAPDEDSFVLYVTDPKYPLSTELVTLSAEQTEIRLDVQLGHPRALSGRIVDDQGHPISGAEIAIESYRGQNVWGPAELFRSDSQGNFTVPNGPLQDDYRLLVLGNGILRTTQTIEPGQDECLIVVSRSGRIYGQVIDADTGDAIACFEVGAKHVKGIPAPWGLDGLTFTSEKGNFDTGWLELVHGASLPVTVHADGYDPLTLEAVPVQVISESPDRTVFGLRRNARRSTVYVGRVVNGEGRPVPGAEVGFRPRYHTPSRKGFSKVLTDA